MIPVIAELYIFVYDKNTGYYKVVSMDEATLSIPAITIDTSTTIQDQISSLFNSKVLLDSNYTNFILSNALVDQDKNQFVVSYYCWIPQSVSLKNNSYFKSIDNKIYNDSKTLQKIMSIF
jgi:hypothetical protein